MFNFGLPKFGVALIEIAESDHTNDWSESIQGLLLTNNQQVVYILCQSFLTIDAKE
jgi:hypothetical protein